MHPIQWPLRRKTVIPVEPNGQSSMTPTTKTIRDQAFRPVECDIPDGMTIAQYRAGRIVRPVSRRRRRPRLRRA
jgi:hypothetical protein